MKPKRSASRRNSKKRNAETPELAQIETLTENLEEQAQNLRDLEDRTIGAEKFSAARANDERAAAIRENEDRIALKNTEAEYDALKALVGRKSKSSKTAKPAVDQITVQKGYEKALAAALGDELDAPIENPETEAYWRSELSAVPGPELPADATPLSHFVTGPKALHRRLAQIGIVDDDAGHELQEVLTTGQRLVSRSGGLWRWDGFVTRPGAESASAKRLAMRNRIKELESVRAEQEEKLQTSEKTASKAREAAETARSEEKKLRDAWREQQSQVNKTRDQLATLERTAQKTREKIAALSDANDRNQSELKQTLALSADLTGAAIKTRRSNQACSHHARADRHRQHSPRNHDPSAHGSLPHRRRSAKIVRKKSPGSLKRSSVGPVAQQVPTNKSKT